jgi:hypothetical protein
LRSKKEDISLLLSKSVTKISRDPQIPVLQTKQLTSPLTCKSAVEQEAEEVEKNAAIQIQSIGT